MRSLPTAMYVALLSLPSAASFSTCSHATATRRPYSRSDIKLSDVKVNVKKAQAAQADGGSQADMQAQAEATLRSQAASMLTEGVKGFADGVSLPDSIGKLELAVKDDDIGSIYASMFEVTIDSNLDYEPDEDKKLRPSTTEYSAATMDDTAVQQRVAALYGMGMRMLLAAGPATSEKIKDVVLRKLATRMGMDGKALDDWVAPLL